MNEQPNSHTVVTVGGGPFPAQTRITFCGMTKVVIAYDAATGTITHRDLRWYERAGDRICAWWRDVRRAASWLRGVTGR